MKLLSSALILATLCFGQSNSALNGKWRAIFTDDIGQQPKTASEIIFDFQTSGERLAGKAHIGNWPGDGPLSFGSIVGDRVEFTVFGNSPWTAGNNQGLYASGLPKLVFRGTLRGEELQLTLLWDSVMLYGPSSAPKEFHLAGRRVTQ